ncbi:hypothetical protein AMJ57_04755 [Parcubacteria bacterium SG8_24]|nr:MAG: hypothetical protein AMJ57_04755 [Parcubacteria bacterium SG8_24]
MTGDMHVDIRVFGKVQGVFFRWSAREEARRLGLAGIARNEPDGSVSLAVEGEAGAVRDFVEWCRSGTESSVVDRIQVTPGEETGLEGFEIG